MLKINNWRVIEITSIRINKKPLNVFASGECCVFEIKELEITFKLVWDSCGLGKKKKKGACIVFKLKNTVKQDFSKTEKNK